MNFRNALTLLILAVVARGQHRNANWPTYGGDAGGQRFTSASQISRKNIKKLHPVWTFHTGALLRGRPGIDRASFEATPILFNGLLYVDSPYDEVFALNPKTGREKWKFDPAIKLDLNTSILTSRGVASWEGIGVHRRDPCAARVFVATLDSRLIALSAKTGKRCTDFGSDGEVDLNATIDVRPDTPYFSSSPPTVVGNVVIVGSGIGDNIRADAENGVVRAFDVRTGRLIWAWDPIPRFKSEKQRTGAANAWSVIAADPQNDLVFVPTGAASPDFFGGLRPGEDRDANSVVALQASTGKRVWGFQVVHHDLWDYDVASEPLLFMWHGVKREENVPAIAITTKQGLVFVLNRLTGEPLVPVHERAVPASDVPGETAWPTQPFPDLPPLAPVVISPDAMLGATTQDNMECRQRMGVLRYEGIYTPPSFRGSIAFPGNLGGVNWGSAAFDPNTGILYANINNYAASIRFQPRELPASRLTVLIHWVELKSRFVVQIGLVLLALYFLLSSMVRRRSFLPARRVIVFSCLIGVLLVCYQVRHRYRLRSMAQMQKLEPIRRPTLLPRPVEHFGFENGAQLGTPYTMVREHITAPTSHHPCTPTPWGAVSALNLYSGKLIWRAPLGTAIAGRHTGTLNLGGDLVTASGLVFTAASEEPLLRAFDSATGEEVWNGKLPVPGQATPMSYSVDGRQYVVIAAGGHGLFGTPVSDAVVAFALNSN